MIDWIDHLSKQEAARLALELYEGRLPEKGVKIEDE
jgi:hypothetical protein